MEYLVLNLQIKIQDAKTQYYTKRIEDAKTKLLDNLSSNPTLQTNIKSLFDLIEARSANMHQRSAEAKLQYILALMDDDDDSNYHSDNNDDDDDQSEPIAV
jgi:hypothetical protein